MDLAQIFANFRAAPPAIPNPQDEPAVPAPGGALTRPLPSVSIELTPEEAVQVRDYQESRLLLAAAGGSALLCAGRPAAPSADSAAGVDQGCPFHQRCPLARMGKAPVGADCPFETDYLRQRFSLWMREFGRLPETLGESERATISSLCWIDLQEQRCVHTLSLAKNAAFEQKSVRDVDQNGVVISWEWVEHISSQKLDKLLTQRRMILREWEFTREAQTRKRKIDGPLGGDDLASRQSDGFDRLRRAQQARVIEASPAQ